MQTPEWFVKRPVHVQMIQWTGDNVGAVKRFVGKVGQAQVVPGFLAPDESPQISIGGADSTKARLWVAANDAWLSLDVGEWIAKDTKGFYPIKDDVRILNYCIDKTYPPVGGFGPGD
jgi:hypothetical protein